MFCVFKLIAISMLNSNKKPLRLLQNPVIEWN
jgi:hypothetical protein